MSAHAGVNELHYHGAPPNRYGHRHDYLSIMHEHDDEEPEVDPYDPFRMAEISQRTQTDMDR